MPTPNTDNDGSAVSVSSGGASATPTLTVNPTTPSLGRGEDGALGPSALKVFCQLELAAKTLIGQALELEF